MYCVSVFIIGVVATSCDGQMKMAEMDVEVGLDAVRDWLVCCDYDKRDADVFLRHGYGSINSIRTEMTENDCNRIVSSIAPGADKYKILSRWSRVKRLQDIPEDNISQELLVRVTKYLKLLKILVRVTRY